VKAKPKRNLIAATALAFRALLPEAIERRSARWLYVLVIHPMVILSLLHLLLTPFILVAWVAQVSRLTAMIAALVAWLLHLGFLVVALIDAVAWVREGKLDHDRGA